MLRVGGIGHKPPPIEVSQHLEWVPLHRRVMEHWPELLRLELLDAVVVKQASLEAPLPGQAAQAGKAAQSDGHWLLKPLPPSLAGGSALIDRNDPVVVAVLASYTSLMRW